MVKKALDRFGWRFQEALENYNGHFKINQNDIDALKVTDDHIRKMEKQQFLNNIFFAKMYIKWYQDELEKNETTIYDTSLRKKMHEFLEKPLNQIIEEFTASLNESEQYKFIEEAGIELKHPITETQQETEIRNKKLSEAINNPEAKKRFLGQVWDYDTVANCLFTEVNNAINNTSKSYRHG